ncbi:MAG: hypothetical protein V4601_05540 [Pseudomonadota bacterium]
MKLTIFAAIIFVAGLWPGLAKYQGGVPQTAPQKHVLTTLKDAPPQPTPKLEALAEKLKLRL